MSVDVEDEENREQNEISATSTIENTPESSGLLPGECSLKLMYFMSFKM